MSADELREAARLIRERAEAATPGPWFGVTGPGGYPNEVRTRDGVDAGLPILFNSRAIGSAHYMRGADAHHIGTFANPAVALAVATWLDSHADIHTLRTCDERLTVPCHALAVVRVYLGTEATA